jgi:hypothetical protein
MNTLFAVEPCWSIRPKSRAWIEAAKPTEDWLQSEVEDENALDVYTFCNDSILEGIKLGTMIGKSGYERRIKKTLKPTPDGLNEPVYVETNNGATLEYVPCANFLIRASEQDPQEATWVGEQHEFTWGQLKRFSQSGRMSQDAVEGLKPWLNDQIRVTQTGDAEEYHQKLDELQNFEPIWHSRLKVFEVWLSYDIDGDGEDEEIVIDFHWESRKILSARANWYADLHRPYRVTQYVKVEGRIWGIGIGKQNEQFQTAVTTIHRQRLDNATLANMRMMAVKKASGISPDEPIFPGKMWFVDDPQNDIKVVQLSEVYRSAFDNESALLRYSERRTGVNEVLLGMPQQGTPGTATGDLARISEGNKRFDLVLKNIRRWLGLLGGDVIANYQQFGDQQRHWLVLGEKGQWVERVLDLPQILVTQGAAVELTATTSVTNQQVEQQQWLALFQVMSQYYDRIISLAQLLGEPEVLIESAVRAVRASDEAMKRLLQTFNVLDAERLLFLDEEERANGRSAGAVGGATAQAQAGAGEELRENAELGRVAGLVRGGAVAGGGGARGGDVGRLAARGVPS